MEDLDIINSTLNGTAIPDYDPWDYALPFDFLHNRIVFTVAYTTVFILCVFGNLMVLFAIIRSARLRSMTNFFLANLAVADFCVGVFCVLPNLSMFLSQQWVLGRAMCKIYYFVWNMCYTASITILTAIAIERYIAITYPLKARRCITHFRLLIAQSVIWIISFLYNIPYLIIFDIVTIGIDYCFYQYNMFNFRALTTINFIVWYIIPLIIMIVIYTRIGVVLWRAGSSRPFQERRSREPQEESYCTSSSSNASESQRNPRKVRMHQYSRTKKVLFENNDKRKKDDDSEPDTPGICLCIEKNSCEYNNIPRRGVSQNYQDSDVRETRQMRMKNEDIEHFQPRTPKATDGNPESYSFSLRFQFYLNNNKTRVKSSKAVRNRRKVIRLLVAVVASFAVCVLPHHIRLLLQYWNLLGSSNNVTLWSPVSFLILYLNSALNPILYALFSANFRKSFKEVLPCKRRRRLPSFAVQDHQHTKTGTF